MIEQLTFVLRTNMYLARNPKILHRLLPKAIWRVPTNEKKLYLTFDDGPIPEVTPWVLEQLAAYNAKATFFCVGENALNHRNEYEQVIAEGHEIGNHTFNHIQGWKVSNKDYFSNIFKCAKVVKSKLFRPPHGKITPKQLQLLSQRFEVIMWDVLSADYSKSVSPKKCAANVIKNAKSGSIIVFHDSLKAERNLRYALPKVLEHFSSRGYVFDRLSTNKA